MSMLAVSKYPPNDYSVSVTASSWLNIRVTWMLLRSLIIRSYADSIFKSLGAILMYGQAGAS